VVTRAGPHADPSEEGSLELGLLYRCDVLLPVLPLPLQQPYLPGFAHRESEMDQSRSPAREEYDAVEEGEKSTGGRGAGMAPLGRTVDRVGAATRRASPVVLGMLSSQEKVARGASRVKVGGFVEALVGEIGENRAALPRDFALQRGVVCVTVYSEVI